MSKLVVALLVLSPLWAAWRGPARAQAGATAAPVHDPAALAASLTREARSDTEKAWAIFKWLAENITYDAATAGLVAVRPESVLVAGKAVCDGYAGAFRLLGSLAGLQVVVIRGWAKGYDWTPGTHFDRPNHAWNAVLIRGRWRLIDSTWGAGYVRNGHFVRQFDEFFFMPPPEALAFTHLPEDSSWALLPRRLTLAEFEAQPVVRPEFFRAGFTAADAQAALASGGPAGLVDVFLAPDQPIRVRSAPAASVLTVGQRYRFEVYAPAGSSATVVNGGEWWYLQAVPDGLAGSVVAHPGQLYVAARTPGGDGRYQTLLRYEVR